MTKQQRQNGAPPLGNENRLTHGLRRTETAILDGKTPLRGLARELEKAVHDEIECDGMLAMLQTRQERNQAAADLAWGCAIGADTADRAIYFLSKFSWFSGRAFRMGIELYDRQQEAGGDMIDAAIEASR